MTCRTGRRYRQAPSFRARHAGPGTLAYGKQIRADVAGALRRPGSCARLDPPLSRSACWAARACSRSDRLRAQAVTVGPAVACHQHGTRFSGVFCHVMSRRQATASAETVTDEIPSSEPLAHPARRPLWAAAAAGWSPARRARERLLTAAVPVRRHAIFMARILSVAPSWWPGDFRLWVTLGRRHRQPVRSPGWARVGG